MSSASNGDQDALRANLNGIGEKLPVLLSQSDVRNVAFQIACGLEHLKAMEVKICYTLLFDRELLQHCAAVFSCRYCTVTWLHATFSSVRALY